MQQFLSSAWRSVGAPDVGIGEPRVGGVIHAVLGRHVEAFPTTWVSAQGDLETSEYATFVNTGVRLLSLLAFSGQRSTDLDDMALRRLVENAVDSMMLRDWNAPGRAFPIHLLRSCRSERHAPVSVLCGREARRIGAGLRDQASRLVHAVDMVAYEFSPQRHQAEAQLAIRRLLIEEVILSVARRTAHMSEMGDAEIYKAACGAAVSRGAAIRRLIARNPLAPGAGISS